MDHHAARDRTARGRKVAVAGSRGRSYEVWSDGILLAVLDIANGVLRYAAEYDGEEWHSSAEQRTHDKARRRAVADDAWHLDVFVAADLFGPQADPITRLRAGADEARRLFGSLAG